MWRREEGEGELGMGIWEWGMGGEEEGEGRLFLSLAAVGEGVGSGGSGGVIGAECLAWRGGVSHVVEFASSVARWSQSYVFAFAMWAL